MQVSWRLWKVNRLRFIWGVLRGPLVMVGERFSAWLAKNIPVIVHAENEAHIRQRMKEFQRA